MAPLVNITVKVATDAKVLKVIIYPSSVAILNVNHAIKIVSHRNTLIGDQHLPGSDGVSSLVSSDDQSVGVAVDLVGKGSQRSGSGSEIVRQGLDILKQSRTR